jgi:hypothetical protein
MCILCSKSLFSVDDGCWNRRDNRFLFFVSLHGTMMNTLLLFSLAQELSNYGATLLL